MRFILAIAALLLLGPAVASAQDRGAKAQERYWATIDTTELYMRVGPSRQYKIAWVYRRHGLPLKVVRVVEGWRLVEDHEGTQGWVNSGLLSRVPGALVVGAGLAAMRAAPAADARLKWNAEPGVVGALGACKAGWCEFNVAGRKGWVRADRLWGSGPA